MTFIALHYPNEGRGRKNIICTCLAVNWFTSHCSRDEVYNCRLRQSRSMILRGPPMNEDIAASASQAILREMASPNAAEKASQGFGRSLIKRFRSLIRVWAKRHRDRQELLTLLDQDHRIAQDMGKTEHELRVWAQKPFWIP